MYANGRPQFKKSSCSATLSPAHQVTRSLPDHNLENRKIHHLITSFIRSHVCTPHHHLTIHNCPKTTPDSIKFFNRRAALKTYQSPPHIKKKEENCLQVCETQLANLLPHNTIPKSNSKQDYPNIFTRKFSRSQRGRFSEEYRQVQARPY